MPRTHALQARPGVATGLHLRITDAERARLERMARREGPGTTVSDIVRRAITSHLAFSSGPSPFLDVFGRVVTDLAAVSVRPILVGMWAAAAHGYLTPTEVFDLVVRDEDVPKLRVFLIARGMPDPDRPLPFEVGRRPWAVRFLTSFGGAPAASLATSAFVWNGTSLDVVTLDGLIEHGQSSLPDFAIDALKEVKAGTHHLDDGERGPIAWDAVGRFTASAAYADPLSRPPHRFVDFRLVKSA
jgi:hypothetical protein